MIAATNKNLREAVKEGAFRQDLYFRLNVIQIVIPPLRDRREDILPLARFFIEHYNRKFKRTIEGVSDGAAKLLLAHDWPGNVRELRNAIERAMILEEIGADHRRQPADLDRAARRQSRARHRCAPEIPTDGLSLKTTSADCWRGRWRKPSGNQTQAARLLRITRDTLRYKMKKFNLR